MKKKILFIQPYYFYGGHFFQSFNNLIKNIGKFKNYEFLVSLNMKIKNKVFFKDFLKIKKNMKIHTFQSSKSSVSNMNAIKALIYVFNLRKKFDVFFFYDFHVFILGYFFMFFHPFFRKKKIIIYVFFGPEFLNKSFLKTSLFKSFLKLDNVQIFCRTIELKKSWQKILYKFKEKIKYIESLDYPSFNFKNFKKKGKLKFASIGQIRDGKSLKFLNDYFEKRKKYEFSIIGGYASQKARKEFSFLNKSFTSKKDFIEFDQLIKKSRSLDYIILLYDHLFDKRLEVSTLYLAVRLKVPIICFKKNDWLSKKISKFKCGYTIKNLNEFKNFPKRESNRYKSYILGLKKFEVKFLNNNFNEKKFYNNIIT